MRFELLQLMMLLLGFTAVACAAEGPAVTDASKADRDFAVQGEYEGEMLAEGKKVPVGVQVIALGDGNFDGVVFIGGLPGAGWKRGDVSKSGKGKWDGDVVRFSSDHGSGEWKDGKITMKDDEGNDKGIAKKVERKSPTLGAKPPEGAVVLFDGSNVDEFPGAKMTDDGLLLAGANSKREFTDFTLHIEFRTPYMPAARGQGRGNSGVYLQNRYEIQVLDSFGLSGENNECGGLYSLKAPAVNMCLPPLAWQTYDIDFTAAKFDGDTKTKNARATIKHNGVVIYDDMELPGITPGGAASEKPGRGPFQLQWHGNPVHFRNIWVVEK